MIMLRFLYKNKIYDTDFPKLFEQGGLAQHVDIPRLESGLQSGAFWSAFMPCPSNGSDFSDEAYAPIVRATLEQLDLFHRLASQYPKYFTPTRDSAHAHAAFKAGRFISPVIIEGLHQIGNSLSTLRLYHQLGVRYATLSWNCHNRYVDAAVTSDPESGKFVRSSPLWHGVSSAGQQLIKEMNRMGMIVDLAHVSVDTMREVLSGNDTKGFNGSVAPPIFSHSSVYSICPHPRNVPDDILKLVKERESLVMINFSPDFVSCEPSDDGTGIPKFCEKNNTLAQVVRHIMYVGEMIGYDYVGIGTDYDGIENTPRGLEDVSKFPDLVAELLKQGVSDVDAGKIVGRNLLRVWREVDEVAARLQKTMHPVEDDIKLGGFEVDAYEEHLEL
ncbi:hypothetical protein LTS18_015136 [Coniosporium uncinatum]|uniref:Uncharacterized protein n=1 Tax=Coniosporium uncinatum TaxID=93489 RepID=A0ACC3CUW3_9PEZI|nr:hypothetical protein LTS18_015136 [Coniosporium uncinatum]